MPRHIALIAVACWISLGGSPAASPARADEPPLLFGVAPVGERLEFELFFHGLRAGEQTVEVAEIVDLDSEPAFRIISRTRTTGRAAALFLLDNTIESFVSVDRGHTLRYVEDIREGERRALDRYEFADGLILWEKRRGAELDQVTTGVVEVEGPMLDPVSIMYRLRGLLAESAIEVGTRFRIPVLYGDTRILAPAVFMRIETVETGFGALETARITSPVTDSAFWFLTGDGRIPVRIEVGARAGRIEGRLVGSTSGPRLEAREDDN